MEVKRKNIGRMASLTALGAGALAATTGTAAAGTIYGKPTHPAYPGDPNPANDPMVIGVSPGSVPYYDITLTGNNVIRLFALSSNLFSSFGAVLLSNRNFLSASINFLTCGCGTVRAFANNNAPAWVGNFASLAPIAYRSRSSSSSSYFFTYFSVTDRYAMFRFWDNGNRYGWLQLLVTGSPSSGPDVTLVDWAWEDSGLYLRAGSLVGEALPAPEPSTFALTGLAALALGAKGLRQWRKSRKKAA